MTKEDYNKLFNTSAYDWFMSLPSCNYSKRVAKAMDNESLYVLSLIHGGQICQQEQRTVMMHDFVQISKTDLLKIRNVGRTVIEFVENTLAEYGLRFCMSKQEITNLGFVSEYNGYRKCTVEIFVPEETFQYYGKPEFERMIQEKIQRVAFNEICKNSIVLLDVEGCPFFLHH